MYANVDFSQINLMDALDLAILIEIEALERYKLFAEQLGHRYPKDAGSVFSTMAENEEKHAEQLYQRRIGYGAKGCPFNCQYYQGKVSYQQGICPTAERMYNSELFTFAYTKYPNTLDDMKDVVKGFEKVFLHIDELREKRAV